MRRYLQVTVSSLGLAASSGTQRARNLLNLRHGRNLQVRPEVTVWRGDVPALSSRVSSWPWCWQQPATSAPALTLPGRRWLNSGP